MIPFLKHCINMLKILEKLKPKISKEEFSTGIDIGASSIKIVKLKHTKEDNIELCDYFIEKAAPTEIVRIIKEKIQPFSLKKVNISVSGAQVIIRNANFPKMELAELKQALKFEAQKYIPFSVEDVFLDCHILKDDLPDNKMLVLIAAVKKDFLNQKLKFWQDTGVPVNLIDIDSLAALNAFNFNYIDDEKIKHKAVALLNIGSAQSNLNIVEDGSPKLNRDINIAGNNITSKISELLKIDLKHAESLKEKPPADKSEKINLAFESALTNLATEVRVSFDYYESQSTTSVVKIFLSGGGCVYPGLKDKLSSMLDIEVSFWDPFVKIIIPESIDLDKLKTVSSQLGVAVGLALR